MEKANPDEKTGCWIWTAAVNNKGYGVIGDGYTLRLAHRVSYEFHHGEIPGNQHLCHSCDNPRCINPEHLRPGTQADNMADMTAKGRRARLVGESAGRAKLKESDVIAIRNAVGITGVALAAQYGVSQQTIGDIRSRRNWSHLP